jgi:large subunit ribosomal protein L17
MRHQKGFNKLGRKSAHRKAMLQNMACSLIEHKRINTTVAKAKALRGFVEPLITKSRVDTMHSRRIVFGHLQDKEAVTELFREVAPKIGERPGGYTRIIKTGFRIGDGAEMCMIELVDFNDVYSKEAGKKKRRRRRRGAGTGSAQASPATEVVENKKEESADQVEAVAEEATTEETAVEETPAETAENQVEGKAEDIPSEEK